MSKSSSSSTNKSLPVKSAWSRGPPQTSAPSPRSQSPAPHLTHSRRPSAIPQGINIKDGVAIPKSNVGAAAKQGSAVSFGSIDDAAAPLSSSPATAPMIKETIVKSFGTVPAAASNGKPNRPAQTPAAAPVKLDKKDIAKLFQSSSAPPPQPPADTTSPSIRNAALPQQPPQFFQPFVPGARTQQQQQQQQPAPPRSPVFPRQLPNGNPQRPSQPPAAPSSNAIPSPRLAPPHAVPQPGPPPAPQTNPPIPSQMGWTPHPYYYPPEYAIPYGAWGYAPGMPPQPGHPHPPHMPPQQHVPPHPMSPHNQPRNLQPVTPTLSHAAPNPVHPPHPPPPISHPAGNISSIASPPPTPSTARLNAASSAFVPQHRTPSKIQIKNPEGKEVDLGTLTKASAAPATTASSGQASPFRQSSPAVPATPKRASIRIESEEQRRERLERTEKEEAEKLREQKEKEEKAKKEKEEEERKKKEEEDKKEAERLRLIKEKEDAERLAKEEEERKKAEEERLKKEAEEREIAAQREAEEKVKREAEEAERLKKEAEEKARLQKEEEERKVKEEADRKIKEEQAAAAKKIEDDKAAEAAQSKEEGEITESTDKERVKEGLRINTSTSNAADLGKRRPSNLDFTGIKAVPIASALSTARNIETLDSIKYPEGISSPKPELNENSKPGRFRYDRDFLLQFREICKDKPPNLPPLDAIGLEPVDPSLMMSRGGSGRHRGASGAPSRQASTGAPFGGPSALGKPGSGFSGGMGNFMPPGRMSSEDRFAMSNAGSRSASVGGAGMPFGRPAAMQRTASQGGQIRERTRSKRGEKRPPADGKGQDRYSSQQQQMMNLEPVAPLQATENRWDRKSLAKATEADTPLIVDRKVKGLLNKLTMEKFESISNQIIEWANKSEAEKNGQTLIQVIRLVFEKATDEATWSEMYARLCRKMMEQISPKVQDDGIRNAEGKPIAGGQLFRKYLLNRCQEDFERGWVQKEATAAAAAAKAADDAAVTASNAAKEETAKKDDEIALYSDEYYAAQKAKRQGLGLIKFIGELFKLQMLTERIMHECVKKLLGNVDNPEEEEIESLCKLLTTVGALLDTAKAHAHMDIYFSRMKELTKSPNVSSRMQYMLQDVIELRDRKWQARGGTAVAAPMTIAQVHEAAAKEKLATEKENMQRQMGMSRTGSNRGRGRNQDFEQGPDGWTTTGTARPVPSKAGDLSQFGKISKQQTMTFGPASVFNKKGGGSEGGKRDSISRSSSSSNMFAMLNADAAPEPKPEPAARRRLVLQPRSVPASGGADEEETEEPEEVAAPAPVAAPAVPDMSDADAKKKIGEDMKELFAVRSIDEAEVYFTALPPAHHARLVETLVNHAVESKAADSDLVASLFERATSKALCAGKAFEDGFSGTAEFLEDIAIDAPHAYTLFAKMVKGAALGDEINARIAAKDAGGKLAGLLS